MLLQLRRCCGIIAAVRWLRSDGRAAAARLPVHATVDTCHLVVTWHVPPCVLFALTRHGGHAHCPIRCYAGLSGCDRQVLFGLICFLQLCIQCSDYVDFRRNRGNHWVSIRKLESMPSESNDSMANQLLCRSFKM